MACERCSFSSNYLTKLYKDGDDPIFRSIEGNSRKHLPIKVCGFCLVGEHVPAFRTSLQKWEIGEVVSFYESVIPCQFLLKFGFDEYDAECVIVASDPFAAYAYDCVIQEKENDAVARLTCFKKPMSSIPTKSLDNLEMSSSMKFLENNSAQHGSEKKTKLSRYNMNNSNISESGLKSRRLWTDEEDEILVKMVSSFTDSIDWEQVSNALPNTTALQCHHRYAIKLKEWTPMEDSVLFHAYYFTSGPKWSYIAKHLHGRNETSVKNRFHHIKRRLEKVSTKLDVNGYGVDLELKHRIAELAKNLEIPWDLTMTVIDLIVHSMKEEIPLMSMNYDFSFALMDLEDSSVLCPRCSLLTPSIQTGDKICKKTGWCTACTQTPAYLFGDMLRIHHSMRYTFQKEKQAM